MKLIPLTFILFFLCLNACKMADNTARMELLKNEVLQSEQAFAEMALAKGVPEAFKHFAAEDAVLLRGETIIKGSEDIGAYYDNNKAFWEKATLEWTPDFIDVSGSGDLAYTYGHYTFSSPDSSGLEQVSSGVFHTVWKRQEDGSWKFVWD